jgi:hypothetical protein
MRSCGIFVHWPCEWAIGAAVLEHILVRCAVVEQCSLAQRTNDRIASVARVMGNMIAEIGRLAVIEKRLAKPLGPRELLLLQAAMHPVGGGCTLRPFRPN